MGSDELFDGEAVRAIAEAKRDLEGPLLPILIAVQERFGFVDDRAVPIIADVLNLSRADVQGVVTFYHDFRREPQGRHLVRLCRAEACQAMGCEALARDLLDHFALSDDGTTEDGKLSVKTTYCLGNCALAPAALVDGHLIGRANVERVLERLAGDTP